MSVTALRDAYYAAWFRCKPTEGAEVPSASTIQELVTVWKELRKVGE
jgi:hypothetical protein